MKQSFAVFITVFTLVAAATAFARPGPGGPSQKCFVNTNSPACNFYSDATPECPDTPQGGGTCGTIKEETGQSGTSPTNPSCLIVMSSLGTNGECVNLGLHSVTVACSLASGGACQ
jgi:hypothetical protein